MTDVKYIAEGKATIRYRELNSDLLEVYHLAQDNARVLDAVDLLHQETLRAMMQNICGRLLNILRTDYEIKEKP